MNDKDLKLFGMACIYGTVLLAGGIIGGGIIKYKLAKLDWENVLKMAEKVKEASAK